VPRARWFGANEAIGAIVGWLDGIGKCYLSLGSFTARVLLSGELYLIRGTFLFDIKGGWLGSSNLARLELLAGKMLYGKLEGREKILFE
jgi:hypothetical protein